MFVVLLLVLLVYLIILRWFVFCWQVGLSFLQVSSLQRPDSLQYYMRGGLFSVGVVVFVVVFTGAWLFCVYCVVIIPLCVFLNLVLFVSVLFGFVCVCYEIYCPCCILALLVVALFSLLC